MKTFRAAACAAVLLCLPPSGCALIGPGAAGSGVELRGSQALYVAEAAFNGASMSLEQATQSGALRGSSAARARQAYGRAHEALLAARRAKAAGDPALAAISAGEAIRQAAVLQAAAQGRDAFGAAGF